MSSSADFDLISSLSIIGVCLQKGPLRPLLHLAISDFDAQARLSESRIAQERLIWLQGPDHRDDLRSDFIHRMSVGASSHFVCERRTVIDQFFLGYFMPNRK